MRAADDARVNPIAGDIVKKGKIGRRVINVTSTRRSGTVYCHTLEENGLIDGVTWPSINQWRRWAATAEVIHVAQEDGNAEN